MGALGVLHDEIFCLEFFVIDVLNALETRLELQH